MSDPEVNMENIAAQNGYILAELENAINISAHKITELKSENKKLREEVNELKRLLALGEKKSERLNVQLNRLTSAGEQAWQAKERKIKERIKRLAAKVTAFENINVSSS